MYVYYRVLVSGGRSLPLISIAVKSLFGNRRKFGVDPLEILLRVDHLAAAAFVVNH